MLPPAKIFAVLAAFPNRFEAKLLDGEAGVALPKTDTALVSPGVVPPKIFCAGLVTVGDANILPVVATELAVDEVGVDDKPKLLNDNDALSIDFAPKMLDPAVC